MQIWPHKHIHTLANFSIQDYKSVFELANRFDALKDAGTKKNTGFTRDFSNFFVFWSEYKNKK